MCGDSICRLLRVIQVQVFCHLIRMKERLCPRARGHRGTIWQSIPVVGVERAAKPVVAQKPPNAERVDGAKVYGAKVDANKNTA